jgi:hypothetical protein
LRLFCLFRLALTAKQKVVEVDFHREVEDQEAVRLVVAGLVHQKVQVLLHLEDGSVRKDQVVVVAATNHRRLIRHQLTSLLRTTVLRHRMGMDGTLTNRQLHQVIKFL